MSPFYWCSNWMLLIYVHINVRHKEHICYIHTNNPTSTYALCILNNRHECGTQAETLELLKPCNKGVRMNCWKTLYIQVFHQNKHIDQLTASQWHQPTIWACREVTSPTTHHIAQSNPALHTAYTPLWVSPNGFKTMYLILLHINNSRILTKSSLQTWHSMLPHHCMVNNDVFYRTFLTVCNFS